MAKFSSTQTDAMSQFDALSQQLRDRIQRGDAFEVVTGGGVTTITFAPPSLAPPPPGNVFAPQLSDASAPSEGVEPGTGDSDPTGKQGKRRS